MGKRGVFICIEGIDTSGKTTHARRLVENLQGKGFDASYTTEPTTGEIGNFIRTRILRGQERVPSTIEALLFAVDRVEHVENTIKPLLQEGKIVISDRYVYSSLAYQGAAGLDSEWIEKLNEHAVRPDLAIFIDVEPETVVQRLKPKKSVMENLETQRKVREVYVKFVEKGELVEIDGNRSKKEVAENILSVVNSFLEKKD